MKKQQKNLAFIFCVILLAGFNSYATDYTRLMDFDGDGKTDVAVYDSKPINNPGYVPTYFRYISSLTGQTVVVQWGQKYDSPIPADYDGDGKTDVAVHRSWEPFNYPPEVSDWWIKSSLTGNHFVRGNFAPPWYAGNRVSGDYDDDGKADPAEAFTICDYGNYSDPTDDFCQKLYAFQDPNNESYIAQILGYSAYKIDVGGGLAAPGDYDGDGATNIAIYDPNAQKFRIFAPPYSIDSENVIRERTMDIDLPAPGDFNGDGRTDYAGVKNFQTQTVVPMVWKVRYNLRAGYEVSYEVTWGMSNEFPVPGDYDGDGKTDIGVYNKSTSTWTIRRSSDLSTMTVVLGDSNDVPTTFPVQNISYFNPYP